MAVKNKKQPARSAKKPAPKKAAKPAKSKAPAKPAPKKAAKPAPKKAAKPVKTAKAAVKKPAPKKAAPAKAVSAKPVKADKSNPVIVAKNNASRKDLIKNEDKVLAALAKLKRRRVRNKPERKDDSSKTPFEPSKIVIATPPTKRLVLEMPKPLVKINKMDPNKKRYSDKELAEFKALIDEKLAAARQELKYLQDQINRKDDNGTDDTENKFATMEDGSMSMEREYLNQMAVRQATYIDHLEKALMRIANKTYGICRVTGKLIDRDRLKAVPHATLSMEAKLMQGQGATPQAQ